MPTTYTIIISLILRMFIGISPFTKNCKVLFQNQSVDFVNYIWQCHSLIDFQNTFPGKRGKDHIKPNYVKLDSNFIENVIILNVLTLKYICLFYFIYFVIYI